MHTIAQMTLNEDGEAFPYGRDWHAGDSRSGTNVLLCSGECYDDVGQLDAEGTAKCTTKTMKRGGITCQNCIEIIRSIKAIKL